MNVKQQGQQQQRRRTTRIMNVISPMVAKGNTRKPRNDNTKQHVKMLNLVLVLVVILECCCRCHLASSFAFLSSTTLLGHGLGRSPEGLTPLLVAKSTNARRYFRRYNSYSSGGGIRSIGGESNACTVTSATRSPGVSISALGDTASIVNSTTSSTSSKNNISSTTTKAETYTVLSRPWNASSEGGGNKRMDDLTDVQVYEYLGVQPAAQKAPVKMWMYAYQLFAGPVIRILHIFDKYRVPNQDLNLLCLYWKAIFGLDPRSPVYDGRMTDQQYAYRLLPRSTRWLIRLLRPLFPRLHHARVELRTTFLDRCITDIRHEMELEQQRYQSPSSSSSSSPRRRKIRLVTCGAGYDIRSIKFLTNGIIDEAYELDLPIVVQAKRILLEESNRLPHNVKLPTLCEADLTNIQQFNEILDGIIHHSNQPKADGGDESASYCNIFLFEGVMVHLIKFGTTLPLLKTCANAVRTTINTQASASIDDDDDRHYVIFTDYIDGVVNRNLDMTTDILRSDQAGGWILEEFIAAPTRTSHFGRARLATTTTTT